MRQKTGDGDTGLWIVRVGESQPRFAVGTGVGFKGHLRDEHLPEDPEIFFGREEVGIAVHGGGFL